MTASAEAFVTVVGEALSTPSERVSMPVAEALSEPNHLLTESRLPDS